MWELLTAELNYTAKLNRKLVHFHFLLAILTLDLQSKANKLQSLGLVGNRENVPNISFTWTEMNCIELELLQ